MRSVVLLVGLLSTTVVSAQDWPRFRGPSGLGIAADQKLPLTWSDASNIVWKTRLPGPGASSPITFGGHVYVTCFSGYGVDPKSPGRREDLTRHLVCVRRQDGVILWDIRMQAGPGGRDSNQQIGLHGYASHTPAADRSGVYVFYGETGAAAYSHDGMLRWQASCGDGGHIWGSAASVLLHDDLVIINATVESDSLIALDKHTGRARWRRKGLCCTWQTPMVVKTESALELIAGAPTRGFSMHGLDPKSGATLWTCDGLPGAREHDGAMTSPIAHNGVVFTHNHPKLAAVRTGGRGNVTATHKLWEIDVFPIIPSPLYHDGHLYWVQEQGTVTCLRAATGKIIFHERLDPPARLVYASPVLADGRIYCLNREGGVYVLAARPEFELLAHNVIESEASVYNASPAVSKGRLLLRSDRFLYCIGKKD